MFSGSEKEKEFEREMGTSSRGVRREEGECRMDKLSHNQMLWGLPEDLVKASRGPGSARRHRKSRNLGYKR